MTSSNTGAVFFLGTRAHYQVLQQPESRSYDPENGNSPSAAAGELDNAPPGDQKTPWNCCERVDTTDDDNDKVETGSGGMKRRGKRRPSETALPLCDKDDDIAPAQLNNLAASEPQKAKPRRRIAVLSFLGSLTRRKHPPPRDQLEVDRMQYWRHLEAALDSCTYRESCRCLECQSSYFDCDESEEYDSSDEDYAAGLRYEASAPMDTAADDEAADDDDEVFVDTVPGDNTSTDLLIGDKDEPGVEQRLAGVCLDQEEDPGLQLEVAAGTPVLLNYLLTHPITCTIQ